MTPSIAPSIGLAEIAAALLLALLNVYVLMGGADFGGGTWDLLASGPRRDAQRQLIASTIGPIWEANHVWLVIVVVVCFTAFPAAFAAIAIVLHVPLALMLIGIVMRGSAFVFRSYGSRSSSSRLHCGHMFAVSSAVTPILLGTVVGAISTDAVGRAIANIGSGSFFAEFVQPWFAPFPIAVGVMALTLFAMLAATYLTVAGGNDAVREDFRRRAIGSAVVMIVAAVVALLLARDDAPFMHRGVLGSSWSALLLTATAIAAAVTIWALWRRRYSLARVAAASEVSLILWGWGAAQFPYLVPPTITIRSAAASRGTLEVLLWVLAGGAVILIPSLAFLLRTFTRRASA